MAKYICGECGSPLKSQKVKDKTGTTFILSYKVLIEQTVRYYKCPNGCELKSVKY